MKAKNNIPAGSNSLPNNSVESPTTIEVRAPIAGEITLADELDRQVTTGELYEKLENDWVRCFACGHLCRIRPGARGICQVRYNIGGKLQVPFNYVAALQCDPTEKKPFYHVLPGSNTLTFGMLGCDLHCAYCQNWDISQALRDANAGRPPQKITADEMVALARKMKAKCVASSYNEPLITAEWAKAVFERAKPAGFRCLFVSNGNATPEVLDYLRPYLDGYKIDLKSMSDRNYRKLGGLLSTILDTIKRVHQLGIWEEIVTLIVPGFNDSETELREAARFIRSVSPDIPWHVTAFHSDYKMTDTENTAVNSLVRAAEIGYEEGLHFVYAGNIPGKVRRFENTYCPRCRTVLIERFGFYVRQNRISSEGKCPDCQTAVPGIWS